ncbi:MAG: MltR family transcriptional regulator [Acidobacteria bacterium]|nr:MltR family transcriptional regulator [Acidobacteriota bacterium]
MTFKRLRPIRIQELEGPAERSFAIVSAAYLEELLKNAIRSRFVGGISREVDDDIFGRSGPLATLNGKIDIAYTLGLIDKRSHHDLHLIRKIRNEFAHAFKRTRFGTPKIAKLCAALSLPGTKAIADKTGARIRPREKYRITLVALAELLGPLLRYRKGTKGG